MRRSPGKPPADTAAVKTRRHGVGRRSRWDLSTLRELWRFKDYGRPERKALTLGVLMRGGEMAADLAAPWPLALVINDLLKGQGQDKSGVLHTVAGWFGGSSMAMLLVAAAAVLVITAASGVFSYLGDMCMNGAGQRITSRIRADVFAYTQRLPMAFHDRQTVGELSSRVVSDTSNGGIDPAGCGHRPDPVRAHPGRHRRSDGRGGLAPRADRARRRPAGVPDRQPLRRPDPAVRPSQARRHRRPDRARHRVPAGHPHRARLRQPARAGPAVRHPERRGAAAVAALGRGERPVHPHPAAGRRRGHRAAVVRRRLRSAATAGGRSGCWWSSPAT